MLASIASPEFIENPYPFYEMGRKLSPLQMPGGGGMWMAFNYDEVDTVLRDHFTWPSGFGPQGGEGGGISMLSANPPRHTRLRGLVSSVFTPRMVERMEPRFRQIADELLDPILASGECDLVEALTYPLPVIVIAEILGVDPAHRNDFKRWSDGIVSGAGGNPNAAPTEVEGGIFGEMRDYFTRMCEERRQHPREDLISGLVRAEIDGEKLDFNELFQMLLLLLVAGNETTTNLIGNAMLEFMAHPDQLARVEADHALIPPAIEEVLRFNSPVQGTVRRASRDLEFKGREVKQGEGMIVFIGAANRDPAQFPEPQTFDVMRTPNKHLAFGMGIHFCLGAPLARLEAKIALEELFKRATNFRRASEGALPRVPMFILRGVSSLPLTFDTK